MTLTQIVNRIKTIALAHKQVRSFYQGLSTDFLTDHTTKYPAVAMIGNTGNVSSSAKALTFNYKFLFVDLVNVAADAKTNELDVQSDMVSVATDILTQAGSSLYNDWKVSLSNNIELLYEDDNDLFAGCSIELSISVIYNQNACAVPSDLVIIEPTTDEDMKPVYDLEYITTTQEGNTLEIDEIAGKKILLIIRESSQIHKVSNNPATAEFTWDNKDIVLGAAVNPEQPERFLILYRKY